MVDSGLLFVLHLSETAVVAAALWVLRYHPKMTRKLSARKSDKKDKDSVNKSGGKVKKKWLKSKVQDKRNNLALFDKAIYDKLWKKVLKYKLLPLRDWRFAAPWPGSPLAAPQ